MSPLRSRLLTAALTLGLGLAGAWPAAAQDDSTHVATVNGRRITMGDVYREIESLPLGDQIAIRQRIDVFAESLVREEVLFQSMLVTDFAGQPALRTQIKELVVQHLIRQHVTEPLSVSEAEIETFFVENTSAIRGEEVRASQILLARREDCEALLPQIDSEASFRRLARERSLHPESAAAGGDIGLFMNHDGPLGFESRLFGMQPGELAIFDSEDGCHLVRIDTRDTPPLPPLERVRDRIRNLLMARKERRLLQDLLQRAETAVTVERD